MAALHSRLSMNSFDFPFKKIKGVTKMGITKKYLRWADPNRAGVSDNWIEMHWDEFLLFVRNEGRRRYFVRINDGEEDGMEVYIMEATRSKYLEWHRENQRRYERRKLKEKKGIVMVSYEACLGDSFFTERELEATDPQEILEEDTELLLLNQSLDALNGNERELLRSLFFDNDDGLNDREIGDMLGIKQRTFSSKKHKILKKIKKYFAENGFFPAM